MPVCRELTIINGTASHQNQHALALAEGVRRCAVEPIIVPRGGTVRTRYVACWGWRLGRQLHRNGRDVLVMERGYLGDRFKWTSLGWNGLNGRATFHTRDDPSRFEAHFAGTLKPWKEGGEYVLLVGQVPGDASLGGADLGRWYEQTARACEQAYGLPVFFRPHPEAVRRNMVQRVKVPRLNGELGAALERAAVVVTFNSNTAVEAVLAGVPTVALDAGTMAREVCGSAIGDLVTPEREAWAARLAWCQWTMDEIKSGEAWTCIQPR